MRFIKLIAPAMLLAGLALLPAHADAQTMGEYATTTAGVSSGGGSMGTNFAPPSFGSSDNGGSSTWGASRLGASFDERAGAASQSSGGNFDSRAGATGSSTSQSRWQKTQLDSGGGQDRFGNNSSDRFGSTNDRFGEHKELSSSQDRFPHSAFSDNRQGLDTHFATGGLDTHYSIGGLDTGGTTSNP